MRLVEKDVGLPGIAAGCVRLVDIAPDEPLVPSVVSTLSVTTRF
jgi:hypothetical protein